MRIILASTSITSGLPALLLPKICILKAPTRSVSLSQDRFPSIIGSCEGIGVGVTSGVGVGVGVGVGGDFEGGLQTLQGR